MLRKGEIHRPSALHGENRCCEGREGRLQDETSSVFLRGLVVIMVLFTMENSFLRGISSAMIHDIIRNCGASDGACTIKRALRVCQDAGDWGVCVDLLRALF